MEESLKNMKISNNNIREIKTLSKEDSEKLIRIRGFVDVARALSKAAFFTIRDRLETIQCVIGLEANPTEDQKLEFKKYKKILVESFVEIVGKVKITPSLVKKCTKQDIEIEIEEINILGPVTEKLSFSLKDASDCGKDNENFDCGKDNEKNRSKVGYNLRLDNRFLDLRVPVSHSIFRVVDGVYFAFRDFLRKRDFIEIKTTKIIQSGSEGGANLFSMNYFDKKAYLAQSPQLYKQMAIIGGLKRVYEIGHVYRAEVSNINRYLSEFTGLDLEMEIGDSYVDTIKFIYDLFVSIFDFLKTEYSKELEIIREYKFFDDLKYSKEAFIINHCEAIDLLKAKNVEIGYEDDFSRENERILGRIIKEKHGIDFFVVKDYPADARPFYTYVCKETGKTRSYDFIMRGEEILSGAQRQNDYELLKEAIISKGISVDSLSNYLEPFKFGAPPHAGCGIGLERVMKSYFNFDDIRYFSMFPRDPNRLYP